MPKRWGSASSGGRIALTPELIHAPSACIVYVIAHEICHLRHPSHSPQFFQLLTSLLPDWQRWKDRLERSELT
jgi:predicted metal-dependent hydrolase